MKFDLHRLRLLRELAHRGTLAAVAEATSYSNSAISQQLSVLEGEIGAKLLVRDGRRVQLTPQALILVEHTSAVLRQLEQAEAEIEASRQVVVGAVRLAAIQTAALACVPDMLSALKLSHPRLSVKLTQAEPDVAIPGLLAREFDLVCDENFPGIKPGRPRDTNLETQHEDPMRVAFLEPPRGRSADQVRLADFAGQPWVVELPGSPGRDWAVAACHQAGFEPLIEHQTSDTVMQAELVSRGLAVAFLPDLLWTTLSPRFHLQWLDRLHIRSLVTTCRAGSQGHPGIVAVRSAFRDALSANRPEVFNR